MKKAVIAVLVIALAALGALIAALPYFAERKFKKSFLAQAAAASGYPARVDRLTVGRNGLFSAGVEGLRFVDPADPGQRTLLGIKRANISVPLATLWRRSFRNAAVEVEGIEARIIRDPGGRVRISGFAPSEADPAMGGVLAGIRSLAIRKSKLSFIDLAANPPTEITLEGVRLDAKSIAPLEWAVEGRAALFDAKQNLTVKCGIGFDARTLEWKLRAVEAAAQWRHLKDPKVAYAFPDMPPALAAWIRKLSGAKVLTRWADGVLDIREVSAEIAQGKFTASGTVADVAAVRAAALFEARAENIRVEELWSGRDPRAPGLEAVASAIFKGQMTRGVAVRSLPDLAGAAEIELVSPRLINLNLLRMILDKLAQVPGMPQNPAAYMPPDVQAILAQPATSLAPMRFTVNAGNGGLFFPDLRIASPGFEIYAKGQMGFAGDVNFKTTLVMDGRMSAILIRMVPRMKDIADGSGRLVLPVTVSGTTAALKITPDMDYILSRVAQSIGQELLTQALTGRRVAV